MGKQYKRAIRIVSNPQNSAAPTHTRIYDLETGEEIQNIVSAVIHLAPGKANEAEIAYLEMDAQGHVVVADGQPVEHTTTLPVPTIDLAALEKLDEEGEKA